MKNKVISILLLSTGVLMVLGLVVLASAGTACSERIYDDPYALFIKQLPWVITGLVLAFVVQRFDYHYFKTISFKGRCPVNRESVKGTILMDRFRNIPVLTVGLYILTILTLMMVFVPGVGIKINGNYRWLNLGVVRMQPGEFAKIVLVIILALWFDRVGERVKYLIPGTWMPFVISAPIMGLTLLEVDLGAFIVMGVILVSLIIAAGAKLINLFMTLTLFFTSFRLWLFYESSNRRPCIIPWESTLLGLPAEGVAEKSSQIQTALQAIHSGGLWGRGYNCSLVKYQYFPGCHSNFIFAIGAEEFGLFFSIAVVVLFITVLVCGMLVSLKAPDKSGRLMALGLTILIVFPALFNLAVLMGLAPTKGVPLPFFSDGGSFICSILIAVGLLVNIARQMNDTNSV